MKRGVMNPDLTSQIERAADAVRNASALVIGAGAGMGVDSGLPDFRGSEGFWKAYPAFRGKQFSQISNPIWFQTDPAQAWGFFGHRYNLYRNTVPHEGFQALKRIGDRMPLGCFVTHRTARKAFSYPWSFTSNQHLGWRAEGTLNAPKNS